MIGGSTGIQTLSAARPSRGLHAPIPGRLQADDSDGTVLRHELIYHDAGATTPEMLTVEELRRLIIEAGRQPVERDTLYRRVERDGTGWKPAGAIEAGV